MGRRDALNAERVPIVTSTTITTTITQVMEPEQKLMLESLELWNYLGMVDVIQNAEQVHAEDYKNSRIGDDTDWRTTATFLLAQCSRPVLESILNGTLPERE